MRPLEWLATIDRRRISRNLLHWYQLQGRRLPWRETSDPYAIWVSEIMLQQTQVATIIPAFKRFLERFPTVADLAAASLGDVLQTWEGLGYYRRARNLHSAAQQVMRQHGGTIPPDVALLRELPGLGKYTANAIASLAFGQRAPVLEANTLRLWSRMAAVAGDATRGALNRDLWRVAEELLPKRRPADFNQAAMDLGALICTPRAPQCPKCPLRRDCRAHAEGKPEAYPLQLVKAETIERQNVAVVLWNAQRVAVVQRPAEGRWAGLWEFPRVEVADGESWHEALARAVKLSWSGEYRLIGERLALRHGIMHYRIHLRCFDAKIIRGTSTDAGAQWIMPSELNALPFSSPQRVIVRSVQSRREVQGELFA